MITLISLLIETVLRQMRNLDVIFNVNILSYTRASVGCYGSLFPLTTKFYGEFHASHFCSSFFRGVVTRIE